jgi:hypothetical protein
MKLIKNDCCCNCDFFDEFSGYGINGACLNPGSPRDMLIIDPAVVHPDCPLKDVREEKNE